MSFAENWDADRGLIQGCAWWSHRAYGGSIDFALHPHKRITIGVASALVVVAGPYCVVAVRGTMRSFFDWLTNFRVRPKEGRHCGFRLESDQLRHRILKAIDALQAGDLDLIICGHSQGGAIAINLAYDLGRDVHRVITFGAPPAFDRRMAAMWDDSHYDHTWRVVNGPDPVPQFLPIQYRHVGRLAYLDGKGRAWPVVRRWDFRRRVFERSHALGGRRGYIAQLS